MIKLPGYNDGETLDANSFNKLSRNFVFNITTNELCSSPADGGNGRTFRFYFLIPNIEEKENFTYRLYIFIKIINGPVDYYTFTLNGNNLGTFSQTANPDIFELDIDPSYINFDSSNEFDLFLFKGSGTGGDETNISLYSFFVVGYKI